MACTVAESRTAVRNTSRNKWLCPSVFRQNSGGFIQSSRPERLQIEDRELETPRFHRSYNPSSKLSGRELFIFFFADFDPRDAPMVTDPKRAKPQVAKVGLCGSDLSESFASHLGPIRNARCKARHLGLVPIGQP